MKRIPEENWPRLSPGTQVGSWRVEAWQGQGAYGAVYRAVRIGQEHQGPAALKLSLLPWNQRFVREAQLLARLSHPGIPRLLDSGALIHPSGAELPFLVMQWVEGTPLYAWAEQHSPSSQELCQVLAHLARTLEALHAAGAVHRDVKGDNVLVQLSDSFPVLIDFGSGHFQGAQRLTFQSLPPGTPAYLSPQGCLFDIRLARQRNSYYPPSPADDLYALGVTAYRLLMGQYPPPMDVQEDEQGAWQVLTPDPRPLLERNPRIGPALREVILRLLSEAPQARGTSAQAAQALEAMANERVPRRPAEPQPAAEVPPPSGPAPGSGSKRPQPVSPPARAWAWEPWLALAALGVCALVLWPAPPAPSPPGQPVSSGPRKASASQAPDAGTAAVGEAAPTEPRAPTPPPPEKKPLAQEPLPEPRPGQARPDGKGRCPGPRQVPINRGCWLHYSSMPAEECVENGGVLFKGKCYTPAHEPPKRPLPTSNPPEAR
jgi:serine/threonine protein kinase